MELLDLEIRFQEALHDAELDLAASGVEWRDLSLLASSKQAFDFRIDQITSRKGVRVDLYGSTSKRLAKFPGLKKLRKMNYWGTWYEVARFENAICAISPQRNTYTSIGKQFTIQVALLLSKGEVVTMITRDNLFRLLGSGVSQPSWFYHTAEELSFCLEEMAIVLARVVAPLKRCFEARFHATAELRFEFGNISAREAFQMAMEFLKIDEAQLRLDGITSIPRYFGDGAVITTEAGRLTNAAAWRLMLTDQPMEREFIVDVPFRGPTRGGSKEASHLSPSIENWCDSTDAAAAIADLIGVDVLRTHRLQLHRTIPPSWLAWNNRNHYSVDCVNRKRL